MRQEDNLSISKREVCFDVLFVKMAHDMGLLYGVIREEEIKKKLKEIQGPQKYFKDFFALSMPEHYRTLGLPLGASFRSVDARYQELLEEYNAINEPALKKLESEENTNIRFLLQRIINDAELKINKITSAYNTMCDHFEAENKALFYQQRTILAYQDPKALAKKLQDENEKRDALFQRYCEKILDSVSLNKYRESFQIQEKILDNFHIFNIGEKLVVDVKSFVVKKYLILLKQEIIDPVFIRMKKLESKKNRNTRQDQILIQFKSFFRMIDKSLIEIFGDSLIKNKSGILIDARLTCEDKLESKKIFDIQRRLFNDTNLLIELHHELCCKLREYGYIEENNVIVKIIEVLKTRFFKKLSYNFTALMEQELSQTKIKLKKQIQFEKNPTIAAKAKNVLHDAQVLEMSESYKETPNYGRLTEQLQEVVHTLKMDNRAQAGERLFHYVERTNGLAGWKSGLGVAIIVLGACLFLAGILIATTMVIPTSGLSAAAGYKMLVGGGTLCLIGAGLFCFSRQKNASNTIRQTGVALVQESAVESQSNPKLSAAAV